MIVESLLGTMLHELNVCQHLHSKLHSENAEWRPATGIRSTNELLQYLSGIGASVVTHFIHPPENHAEAMDRYRSQYGELTNVTFDSFVSAIDREKEELKKAFNGLTDSDLSRMTYYPWNGQELSLFDALTSALRYLTAYRHQLFLYAKMNGANINTMNNWGGMDMPMPTEAPKEAATA